MINVQVYTFIMDATSPSVLHSTHKPGRFGRRLMAGILDACFLSVLLYPAVFLLQSMGLTEGAFDPQSSLTQTGYFLLWLVNFAGLYGYYGWFYHHRGATPGKEMMGLKVLDAQTGLHVSFNKAFFRETLGKWLSSALFGMGFVLILFRVDARALHDLVCKTYVVDVRPDLSADMKNGDAS